MLRGAFRRRFGFPGHPKMSSKPREKIVRKTSLFFSHFSSILGAKRYPFLSYASPFFPFVFDVFFRLAPDPHPRGLETRFGAILVDFGVISGWIWARILSLEKGEFREKILQRPCTKSCRRLGLPHPHAQTLRVRRSRASVLNSPYPTGVLAWF